MRQIGSSPAESAAAYTTGRASYTTGRTLLQVDDLSVRFRRRDAIVSAVTGATFDVRAGECLALVGESGCGKSVLATSLLGLLPAGAEIAGQAWLRGVPDGDIELLSACDDVLTTRVRGRLAGLVPQSPGAHLTPVRTVRSQLAETVRQLDSDLDVGAAADRARFPADHLDHYPHELSGGLAQRAVTALALAGRPWLLLADEPTTGLDRPLVDDTMAELRRLADRGHGVVLVTHDLDAARRAADRVAVMYAGRLVEIAPAGSFFDRPAHPYSRALLDALPDRGFTPVPGRTPELTRLPTGCAFQPRCGRASTACGQVPPLATLADQHRVACFHPERAHDATHEETGDAAS